MGEEGNTGICLREQARAESASKRQFLLVV